MSWSVNFIGHPKNVVTALQKQSEKMDGHPKVEYDAALPHLVGLVSQNFSDTQEPIIKLSASGHGYAVNGEQKQRQCIASIEIFYAILV